MGRGELMNKLEIPNLDRWRAGEQPDEDMFNDLQDSLEFMLDPPTVKVHKTASQNISNDTFTLVTWDEAVEDNCKPFGIGYQTAQWDPSSSSALTCRVGGWYEVQYTVAWNTRVDDGRRMSFFEINGDFAGLYQKGRRDTWHVSDYTVVTVEFPVFLNVEDFIRIWVLHNAGATTSLVTTTPEYGRRSQFKMKWVSL